MGRFQVIGLELDSVTPKYAIMRSWQTALLGVMMLAQRNHFHLVLPLLLLPVF